MRLIRNRLKRLIRRGYNPRRFGVEGPMCLSCAGPIGGRMRRQTATARAHALEIRDGYERGRDDR